jgi:hypothetical protein
MYLKNLAMFEKASHYLKKASISLKMPSKRIEIFKKKNSIHFKKASISLDISLKCHTFLKKWLTFSKKSLVAIAALPQWPVHP